MVWAGAIHTGAWPRMGPWTHRTHSLRTWIFVASSGLVLIGRRSCWPRSSTLHGGAALVWVVASMALPGITWPRRLSFLAVGLICLVGGLYSALLAFLRAGRLGDRQVVRRRERHRVYAAILGWVVGGILAVMALGAPRWLVAVAVVMLTG